MLFTVLILGLAFMIYFSNRNNETNRWLAGGMAFISLGTFKEYLYYDLWPNLPEVIHAVIPKTAVLAGYSVITAFLYAFASPLFLISTLFFSEFPKRNPQFIKYIKPLVFVPGVIVLFIYPPINFSAYQHSGHAFWYTFSIYNFIYTISVTYMQIKTVLAEKDPVKRRQKRFVVMIILPPLWFCFITIYVIHSLWIEPFLKLWKMNVFIVAFVVMLYIYLAFREGVMGIKLHGENYRWDTDMKTASKGMRYISHILKNEITKIEWSTSNLEKQYVNESSDELAIIRRSTEHLKQFVNKTQLYSNDILLCEESCNIKDLVELSILSTREYIGGNVSFTLDCPEKDELICDKEHVIEVLNNLFMNGADAMNKKGKLSITYERNEKSNLCKLSVKDEGFGIEASDRNRLFEPYFTTKKTNMHFGLGLAYSANVMRKHGGYIDVQSVPGKGSTFTLCFSINRR